MLPKGSNSLQNIIFVFVGGVAQKAQPSQGLALKGGGLTDADLTQLSVSLTH
jgi:hypothetical protein